jgi:hypothetical protein
MKKTNLFTIFAACTALVMASCTTEPIDSSLPLLIMEGAPITVAEIIMVEVTPEEAATMAEAEPLQAIIFHWQLIMCGTIRVLTLRLPGQRKLALPRLLMVNCITR